MMLGFAERMFGIANRFAHDFECFHHSYYLSVKLGSENDAK